jgi:hypothetical protein
MVAAGSVVAADLDSLGRPRRLWRAGRQADVDLVAIELVNSTPEPDGSFRTYWLRVPPHVRRCREAVAWSFGLAEHHWVEPVDES